MALIDNLISYYKLDAVAGAVIDSHGANNGTNVGATRGVAGKIINAFSFDGINDEVQFSHVFGLGNTDVSINCWVNLDSTSENGAFVTIGKGKTVAYNGYSIGVGTTTFDNTGNILIALFENVRWIVTGTSIGTGWHMVTLAINGSGVPSVYLDGSFINSYPGTNAFVPTTESEFGGYLQAALNRHVDATIDEVGIWNRALSGPEISALWNGGAGLAYPFAVVTNMKINIGDVFKDIESLKINIGDAWKNVIKVQQNIGGVWKNVFG